MIKTAAGIMFLTEAGETLLLKRGPGGDFPGAWCFPGGSTEGDETAEETAKREAIEELGSLPKGERVVLTRSTGAATPIPATPDVGIAPVDPVDYTTFLQRIPERFDPQVNGEHTGFAWCKPDQPPEPLHPGCRIALARLTMNELDIARAMAAGELTSPQRYMNVWLFDIRISGTGHAYRGGIEEHVWRKPEIYLTDEFLARCNGLTVIWVHPDKGMLNSKEFAKRVIGSIFLPYIKGEDVWGIAKIYDDEAAADMATQDLSTSPGVILGNGEDVKIKLPDGSPLLIEDDPRLLDHIAVVPAGVWDKGGDPSGIRTDSVRNTHMADETEAEKKEREDAARRDAERQDATNIASKVMDALDSFGKRMDAMEMDAKERRDREEKDRKDSEERERKDRRDKRDAERKDWEEMDAAQCAMDDAEEEKEAKEHEAKGEEKEDAADHARKDRRDRMDKRRKDAEKAEKDRKDAERKDAALLEKQVADAVRAHLKDDSPEERDAKADAQARADSVYRAFNDAAPPPMRGETAAAYDIRLLKGMQKHSAPWKDVDLHLLPDTARAIARTQIYADAVTASNSVDNLPDGQLIPRVTHSPLGHQITEFRGRGTFIGPLKRPSMRVTKFNTERRA